MSAFDPKQTSTFEIMLRTRWAICGNISENYEAVAHHRYSKSHCWTDSDFHRHCNQLVSWSGHARTREGGTQESLNQLCGRL
jgi:hypothetical protein